MAVAAALTLFLGVALGRNDNGRLDRLEALAEDMEKAVVSNAAYAALNDSRNEQVQLVSATATPAPRSSACPDGTGYLVPSTWPPAPPGGSTSCGRCGPTPRSPWASSAHSEVSAFRMNGPVAAFAVTEEAGRRCGHHREPAGDRRLHQSLTDSPGTPLRCGGMAGFGVYVHVPFCARRCDYCDFATWTDRHHLMEAYAAACVTDLTRRYDRSARPAGHQRLLRRRHARRCSRPNCSWASWPPCPAGPTPR